MHKCHKVRRRHDEDTSSGKSDSWPLNLFLFIILKLMEGYIKNGFSPLRSRL